MKKGPFKMKKFSGFGNSPAKKTTGKGPTMPKDHPVTPPTEEQSNRSKGTLRGIETDLERARRGLGLTKEQLKEEQRKQREALKKYEQKYGR